MRVIYIIEKKGNDESKLIVVVVVVVRRSDVNLTPSCCHCLAARSDLARRLFSFVAGRSWGRRRREEPFGPLGAWGAFCVCGYGPSIFMTCARGQKESLSLEVTLESTTFRRRPSVPSVSWLSFFLSPHVRRFPLWKDSFSVCFRSVVIGSHTHTHTTWMTDQSKIAYQTLLSWLKFKFHWPLTPPYLRPLLLSSRSSTPNG